MSEHNLAANGVDTVDAQGVFVYVEESAGLVGVTAFLDNGVTTEEAELNQGDQYQYLAGIRKIRVRDLSGSSQTVKLKTGHGRYIPRNDNASVQVTNTVAVSGPLTDTQIRATALPVSGPLTDTQLRATPVPVSGGLTDTQLRATPVPVSGGLTDTQLRATAVPVTLGGTSRFRLVSAATTNANGIAAVPSKLHALNGTNTSGATVYLKLYDLSAAPTVGSDTPVEVYALLAGAPFSFTFGDRGAAFATGIAIALTGAVGDSDTTAIGAGDVVMQAHYSS